MIGIIVNISTYLRRSFISDNKFAQDERVLEAIHWVDRDRFAKDGYVDSPHNFGTNSIVERPSYVSKKNIFGMSTVAFW